MKPAWVPGGTKTWLLLRILGDRPSQKEILGGQKTGENALTVYVLRRAPIPASHHVSNSKSLNITFPQRLRDTEPAMREQALENPKMENKELD